jgi:D-glycero-alpha-D-manno-heptose-7-phosphate kinase
VKIRSKAPLRVSFSGGGTDVPPFPEERGGCVLSATIDKYAYTTLEADPGGNIGLHSLDYDIVANYQARERLPYDGKLDLVKAAFNTMGVEGGCEMFIHTDAPPGSGLGSSSTLCVALVGAIARWKRLPLTMYEVAETAYRIERQELKIMGGLQDQYAAAFGGFNFIEFNGDSTVVNPLKIRRDDLNELAYNLLLCYTGGIRLSAEIVKHQTESYQRGEKQVLGALLELKQLTLEMKNALLLGRVHEFGSLLNVAWENKRRLDVNISTPQIDEMYEAALALGALGGKILGAGGGGYLLLYCPFRSKYRVAERLEAMGGQVVEFGFEFEGMQTWRVPEGNGPNGGNRR